MVLNNAVCAQSADPAAAGSGLAAKAFAPASCFPSSLRRVNISQVHQTCEMFRLKTVTTSFLERLLGIGIDLSEFYRLAARDAGFIYFHLLLDRLGGGGDIPFGSPAR